MNAPTHRVARLAVNLRTSPQVRPSNRVATLPQGHLVQRLGEGDPGDWWRVLVTVHGTQLEGWIKSKLLDPIGEPEPAARASAVAPVHLRENHPDARRSFDGARAFPIGEAGRPTRSAPNPAALLEIVAYLSPATSTHLRYQRKGATTYCNILAADYCYLADAYLPRVWWTGSALADLAAGRTVLAEYDRTVREVNANGLYAWLAEHGPGFGWQRTFETDALQQAADAGEVCLIVARRRDRNRSGHISVVVPQTAERRARLTAAGDRVVAPLQCQAGWSNHDAWAGDVWWAQEKFDAFSFWRHE